MTGESGMTETVDTTSYRIHLNMTNSQMPDLSPLPSWERARVRAIYNTKSILTWYRTLVSRHADWEKAT